MDWDPLKDILNIHERVNRIFQDAFNSEESSGTISTPVDIYETETEIIIVAELPGVDENSINIELRSNILTIEGEKKSPIPCGINNCTRIERSFGKFKRSFSLPPAVNSNKVNANIKDGILTLTMQKESAGNKKIIKVIKG